ncbi:MAG: hypothetical protein M4579_001891 [Chaenotheca gracillima]|nr:MAG: hypothetical protein M4579_001891 [Chaenotheca gracillima]
MAADPINANPTILNPSDLPTRRHRPSNGGSKESRGGFFGNIETTAFGAGDPFADGTTSPSDSDSEDDSMVENIDEQEIFDLISTISDPEHPLSLGSLAVVSLPDIHVEPPSSPSGLTSTVTVLITPTITHCSLATVIGLGVRVRLEQALPPRFRIDVKIKEGSHSTGDQVTKQLNDKERVAAALENGTLMGVLNKMLETCQ